MSGRQRALLIGAITLIAIVLLVIWFKRPQPIAVTLTEVAAGEVERTVTNTRAGTLTACRRARLSPSIGGQIANLPVAEGDTVEAGQLLFEIWNDDLRAQRDLAQSQIRANQARTVDVEVNFTEVDKYKDLALLPGYSADIEVILARHPDTLRIPTEALLEGLRVYVYDANAGTISARAVKTGLSNWQHTEILDGLQAGQQIVLSIDREGLADGARVEPEDALRP